jgi:ATP-binding cassette, subfamily B, multidrug efflux pump
MNHMFKTMKKVWRYVTPYKKLLSITMIAMLVVQLLGLAAPLLVKTIMDDYLVGIEKPWYQTTEVTDAVRYQDRYFQQDTVTDQAASIVVIGTQYYFTDSIVVTGQKIIEGNQLTILTPFGETYVYEVTRLSRTEVFAFYQPSIQPLIWLIGLLLIRFLLHIFFTYIQRISASMITINMVRDARKDAVKSLQRMPMSYFESEPSGKIAKRVISDVGGMMGLFSTIMNLLVNASMAVVFAYVGMFYLNAGLAWLTLLFFPLVYVWMRFFVKKLNKIAIKVSENSSMITAQLNEIINGISILQIFNFRKSIEKKFHDLSLTTQQEVLKEQHLHLSIGWNMIRLVGALVTALIIVFFGNGYLTISGFVVTAGLVYAYNDYLSRLVEPVGTLFREIGNLQHSLVRTDRIFKIIDGEQEDSSFVAIPRYQGNVLFDDVWFSYQKGHPILKGITLQIKSGEMIGLVGHTGSGKSTLTNLLLRFYDFKDGDRGKIYVDGVDITQYSKRTFRSHIGIIIQDPVMFKGTIADNIRFGISSVTDAEAEKILREVGGDALLNKLEKGIHQPVSRGGANLSVGEKQLISFARALVHDPSILIMDEATANIDTETEKRIQLALEKARNGRTLIVIAHRLSTIKNANKIVVLDNGLKVEEGTHKQLIAANQFYANMYRSQIKTRIE